MAICDALAEHFAKDDRIRSPQSGVHKRAATLLSPGNAAFGARYPLTVLVDRRALWPDFDGCDPRPRR